MSLAPPSLPPPCLLAIDAALGSRSVAIVAGGVVLAECAEPGGHAEGERLAPMVAAVLHAAGLRAAALDAVAVTVGPGSFTGIRAALALSHGMALTAGGAPVAVTVAEAIAAGLPPLHGRALWVATDSRRGRVFLDIDGQLASLALDALPIPSGPVAVAGDAAIAVMARLAARGCDVRLMDARGVRARDVARVAAARLAGNLAPLAAVPLYVDAPEARLPAGGLRPAPA